MLARFGRIAMVAAVFSLIASGIVAIQYVMDGRPFDTRFFGACIFFAASIFALAAGYGLGDELRCALQRGGLRVAWPWLGIIAIMAGLFWSFSSRIDAVAGMNVGPIPPLLLILGAPAGAIRFRRKP